MLEEGGGIITVRIKAKCNAKWQSFRLLSPMQNLYHGPPSIVRHFTTGPQLITRRPILRAVPICFLKAIMGMHSKEVVPTEEAAGRSGRPCNTKRSRIERVLCRSLWSHRTGILLNGVCTRIYCPYKHIRCQEKSREYISPWELRLETTFYGELKKKRFR